MKTKLTKRSVESIPLPPTRMVQRGPTLKEEAGSVRAFDTELKGFGVRVTSKGRRTYFFMYRLAGQRREVNIGLHGPITAEQARTKALKWASDVAHGKDPAAKETHQVLTVADLAREFLAVFKSKRLDQERDILERRILPTFGGRVLGTIKTLDVTRWHAGITKQVKERDPDTGKPRRDAEGRFITYPVPAPHAANRALDTFKLMWNWGEGQDILPKNSNPCVNVAKHKVRRNRHYKWTVDEVRRFAAALNALQARAEAGWPKLKPRKNGLYTGPSPSVHTIGVFRFLMFSGNRKGEVLSLRWDQIDWDGEIITWGDHKTDEAVGEIEKDLTEPLREVLEWLWKYRVKRVKCDENGKPVRDDDGAPLLEDNPYVFVSADRQGHLVEVDGVWTRRFVRPCALVKADGLKARPHDLRHMYGDLAVDCGLSRPEIMKLMNHATEAASALYAKGSDPVRKANAAKVAKRLKELTTV